MTAGPPTPSPVAALSRSDPGDQTQRNFRYQHGYGVILLLGGDQSLPPYTAIWCEQHEDFLGERRDGRFDAIQVKTGQPENGPWTWAHDAIRDSVKRFVLLNSKYPDRIGNFLIVSNVQVLDSHDADQRHRSPLRLLETVARLLSPAELATAAPADRKAFDALKKHCDCNDDQLFAVLKKLAFLSGPTREGFEAVIAHESLPKHPMCRACTAATLNDIRDHLISRVFQASSLRCDDPARYYSCLQGDGSMDPRLRAKRIPLSDVALLIEQAKGVPFQFVAGVAAPALGTNHQKLSILEQKLVRGDLADQVASMQMRALSAEQHLMELAHIEPDSFGRVLDQLAGIVKGECDEALLEASTSGEPFGRDMLTQVYERLRHVASERPEMVHRQQYECLIGVAGLLTAECIVWWSSKFALEDKS